jgi:site-specific recombinase XerD
LTKFNKSDYELNRLDHAFITELERYFKQDKACNHNTTMKYIKNLKRVVHFAIELGWLDKDPFQKFKTPIKEVKREILTEEELEAIENKEITIPRLELVRDVFVFACYTGLAFIDIDLLTKDNLVRGIDGNLWIHTDRKKTGTKSHVPLLPKAKEILDKYKEHPISDNMGKLLPVFSNQKLNAYLKEIAGICGIKNNLTFHLARHTFATTVTLLNGVPIETVGAMLGHKNLRTTQIYSKVIDKKISDEMQPLMEKLDKTKTGKQKNSII